MYFGSFQGMQDFGGGLDEEALPGSLLLEALKDFVDVLAHGSSRREGVEKEGHMPGVLIRRGFTAGPVPRLRCVFQGRKQDDMTLASGRAGGEAKESRGDGEH